jgi:hypothetical protein
MTPKSTKHAPTKGEERPLPVTSMRIGKIPSTIVIPIAPRNGFLGNREHPNGLNVAKSSAVQHDEDSKPDPVISTNLTFQDDATRDDKKRKARSTHMHHTGSERTTKRPKNKQDQRAMSDTEDNTLNDEDRKPAAKKTSPTPCPSSNDEDRKPAAKSTSPTPDGVPSTCAGFKRKSASTCTESVVSTSTQGIKLEPGIKTETVPANTSTDQAPETSIPSEVVSQGPNLNRKVTVRRKVAKRTDPLYIVPPPPQNIAAPLPPSPTPQVEEIPARLKPRVEEPLPTTKDESARRTAAPDLSEGLPSPDTPLSAATVDVSTHLRSRRQTQLPPIETSEAELDDSDASDDADDADYVGDGDLSGPVPPPTANVNISTRHRSSRRTGTPVPPPPATVNVPTRRRNSHSEVPTSSPGGTPVPSPTATVDAPTLRQSRSRRQIQLPPIVTREAELDDSDTFDDALAADDDDHDGDLRRPSWEDRLSELVAYHRIYGNCNVPQRYRENIKLGKWVTTLRQQYKGNRSPLSTLRIQTLESLGFEWDSRVTSWEDRLSELADYRKIHGRCNVPRRFTENTKLGTWVANQRNQYRLHREGKTSPMTALRIQALERLGFEWDSFSAAWEVRLSELADYRKIHGHCNVPYSYSENTKLGYWIHKQRSQYKLHLEGKKSTMTASRIQAFESLGFE